MRVQSIAGGASLHRAGRARLLVLAFLVVGIADLADVARGAGQYLKVDYPGSTEPGKLQTPVTYTLWIPGDVPHLRAIIVHQHGAGTTASIEGSTAAYDLHWQALARKWDCALFSSSYHVTNEEVDLSPGGSELWFDPRHGSEQVFLKALDDFAAMSGHPEIATVPWALWGHSGGGIWADIMSALHPERIAAVWMRSGSAAMFRGRPEFSEPAVPPAVYGIPSMCNPGVKEKPNRPWVGPLATFQEYRAQGAFIGFAPDPRTGHECGDSRYLAIPFFDACLAMRLPDKGSEDQTLKPVDQSHAWLATPLGDQAVPAASYQGNPNEAVWLPNEAVAKAWMEYVKTGAVSDTTPPPAPHDVIVTPKGDQGTLIEWSADADFESGIRCFVVLRDGSELAQVPQTPMGKFGRPLFQSMTYHDTPSQPMPQMRYLDTSAKAGEKHAYAVVAVNSVELKSESAASSSLLPWQREMPLREVAAHIAPYPTWERPEGVVLAGMPGVEPRHLPGDHFGDAASYPTILADEINLDSPKEQKDLMLRSVRMLPSGSTNRALLLLGEAPAPDSRRRTERAPDPEALLNSRSGRIHLFPVVEPSAEVAFHEFQASGGFLVSAARNAEGVSYVEIQPRRDNQCRLMNPWPGKPVLVHEAGSTEPVAVRIDRSNGECLIFATVAGHLYLVERE
jgi:hypothetical protein